MALLHPTPKIADALEALSSQSAEWAGGLTAIGLNEPGERLLLAGVEQASPLAVACRTVVYETLGLPDDVANLRAWGHHVADRVTYLFERLELQEVDDEAGRALLRSARPRRRHGLRGYYQVELARSSEGRRTVSLSRMAFDESTRTRSAVPMQLTVETLERLAEDLGATAR
jgi:hypothetical protein